MGNKVFSNAMAEDPCKNISCGDEYVPCRARLSYIGSGGTNIPPQLLFPGSTVVVNSKVNTAEPWLFLQSGIRYAVVIAITKYYEISQTLIVNSS